MKFYWRNYDNCENVGDNAWIMITAEPPVHPDATEAEVINTHAKLGRKVVKKGSILKVHPANILDTARLFTTTLCVENKLNLFWRIRNALRRKCRVEYCLDSGFDLSVIIRNKLVTRINGFTIPYLPSELKWLFELRVEVTGRNMTCREMVKHADSRNNEGRKRMSI